jgi:hypothetical protein
MRKTIIILFLMSLITACRDSGPSQPTEPSIVFVNFEDFLQGDSVIVHLESTHVWSGRIDTNLVHGTTGLRLVPFAGFHVITIELPFSSIRAGTSFISMKEYTTEISVHYDGTHRTIKYQVHY